MNMLSRACSRRDVLNSRSFIFIRFQNHADSTLRGDATKKNRTLKPDHTLATGWQSRSIIDRQSYSSTNDDPPMRPKQPAIVTNDYQLDQLDNPPFYIRQL